MAWYRTGTVSVQNNSKRVIGDGASFIAGGVEAGNMLVVDDSILEIARVIDQTEVELAVPYTGVTATGLSYVAITNVTSSNNYETAQKIEQFLSVNQIAINEFSAWVGGVANGGTGSTGKYPLTDRNGNTYLVKSPARLEKDTNDFIAQMGASGVDSEHFPLDAWLDSMNLAIQQAKTDAQAASTAAIEAKDLSRLWAFASQGTVVNGEGYSAKHYALTTISYSQAAVAAKDIAVQKAADVSSMKYAVEMARSAVDNAKAQIDLSVISVNNSKVAVEGIKTAVTAQKADIDAKYNVMVSTASSLTAATVANLGSINLAAGEDTTVNTGKTVASGMLLLRVKCIPTNKLISYNIRIKVGSTTVYLAETILGDFDDNFSFFEPVSGGITVELINNGLVAQTLQPSFYYSNLAVV